MFSPHDDLPLFTPVPAQRATANGWSAEVQRVFIASLAKCGVVSAAARSVGRSPRSAWMLRKRAGAEEFAAAWDMALAMGRDMALARAIDSVNTPERVPVLYQGRIVGWRERHNDSLAMAALRAHHRTGIRDPAYREARAAARETASGADLPSPADHAPIEFAVTTAREPRPRYADAEYLGRGAWPTIAPSPPAAPRPAPRVRQL